MSREAHPFSATECARWLSRVASVSPAPARLGLWCEMVETYPPEAAARLLDYIVHRTHRAPEARVVFLAVLDLEPVKERVGPGKMAALLTAAREAALDGAMLLLEEPGRKPGSTNGAPDPPDPIGDQLTLGHKKKAARGVRSPVMERLLKDPDPRVVREALRNTRLREEEVVYIASRRPCAEEVFRLIASAPPWIVRPRVQRAVALNPYAPPRLALALCVCLASPDLGEVARQERLHPAVRDGALEILAWREEATPG